MPSSETLTAKAIEAVASAEEQPAQARCQTCKPPWGETVVEVCNHWIKQGKPLMLTSLFRGLVRVGYPLQRQALREHLQKHASDLWKRASGGNGT